MEAVYRSFYTESPEITRYMVAELEPRPESLILEPCAGHGALIEAVLGALPNANVHAYEINPSAFAELNRRYGENSNVSVNAEDFLSVTSEDLFAAPRTYDRIIGNPPYGGWQDYERRRELKLRFPDLYVKETYGLFLYNSIRVLRPGGVLVFIVPDTFLNLHMHTPLRRFILDTCKVRKIAVFPSSLFPGVRFGYSKLCIITLERCESARARQENQVELYGGMEEPGDLGEVNLARFRRAPISQVRISQNPDHAVLVSAVDSVVEMINSSETKLGDIAEVVTGFYTGDDKRHLRMTLRNDGRRRGYAFAGDEVIADQLELGRQPDVLTGLTGPRHFVPIVKGGGVPYWKPIAWVVDWNRKAVKTYNEDPKARFQNSRFYFKHGIAVPMVTSTRVSATIMDGSIFDQSIVGIFPRDLSVFDYLLAFFNSPTCTTLLRTLNPSANNSANYMKKLPILLPPDETLVGIGTLVEHAISNRREGRPDVATEKEIEDAIRNVYGF